MRIKLPDISVGSLQSQAAQAQAESEYHIA